MCRPLDQMLDGLQIELNLETYRFGYRDIRKLNTLICLSKSIDVSANFNLSNRSLENSSILFLLARYYPLDYIPLLSDFVDGLVQCWSWHRRKHCLFY